MTLRKKYYCNSYLIDLAVQRINREAIVYYFENIFFVDTDRFDDDDDGNSTSLFDLAFEVATTGETFRASDLIKKGDQYEAPPEVILMQEMSEELKIDGGNQLHNNIVETYEEIANLVNSFASLKTDFQYEYLTRAKQLLLERSGKATLSRYVADKILTNLPIKAEAKTEDATNFATWTCFDWLSKNMSEDEKKYILDDETLEIGALDLQDNSISKDTKENIAKAVPRYCEDTLKILRRSGALEKKELQLYQIKSYLNYKLHNDEEEISDSWYYISRKEREEREQTQYFEHPNTS